MNSLERLEYQRRNRRVLYAIMIGIVATVVVLRVMHGVI